MKDRYEVKAFYNSTVTLPKKPEMLAFHTWNTGTFSRDMEIQAAQAREDIGLIQWRPLNAGAWRDVCK